MITRPEVIQSILNLFVSPIYLEIGVSRGLTFRELKAAHKIAVDPKFLISEREQSSEGMMIEYFECTSDEYFGNFRPKRKCDVVYVDGLHTFEQALRDVLNAIFCISELGIIVVDDVLPKNYSASLPDEAIARLVRNETGVTDPSWMGDVYKLVFFIETFLREFSFATVSDNHGQLILWRQPRTATVARSLADICSLDFSSTISQKQVFKICPFSSILAVLTAPRARDLCSGSASEG